MLSGRQSGIKFVDLHPPGTISSPGASLSGAPYYYNANSVSSANANGTPTLHSANPSMATNNAINMNSLGPSTTHPRNMASSEVITTGTYASITPQLSTLDAGSHSGSLAQLLVLPNLEPQLQVGEDGTHQGSRHQHGFHPEHIPHVPVRHSVLGAPHILHENHDTNSSFHSRDNVSYGLVDHQVEVSMLHQKSRGSGSTETLPHNSSDYTAERTSRGTPFALEKSPSPAVSLRRSSSDSSSSSSSSSSSNESVALASAQERDRDRWQGCCSCLCRPLCCTDPESPNDPKQKAGTTEKSQCTIPLTCLFIIQIMIILITFAAIITTMTFSEQQARAEGARMSIVHALTLVEDAIIEPILVHQSDTLLLKQRMMQHPRQYSCSSRAYASITDASERSLMRADDNLMFILDSLSLLQAGGSGAPGAATDKSSGQAQNLALFLYQQIVYKSNTLLDGKRHITECLIGNDLFRLCHEGLCDIYTSRHANGSIVYSHSMEADALHLSQKDAIVDLLHQEYTAALERATTSDYWHPRIFFDRLLGRTLVMFTLIAPLEPPPGVERWTLAVDLDLSHTKATLRESTPVVNDAHTSLYVYNRIRSSDAPPYLLLLTSDKSMELDESQTSQPRMLPAGSTPVASINRAYAIAYHYCPSLCPVTVYNSKGRKAKDVPYTGDASEAIVVSFSTIITSSTGLRLLLVQSVPYDYYYGELERTRLRMIIIGVCAGVLITIVGIIVLALLRGPITAMQENFELAALMQNDKVSPIRSYLSEMAVISTSFARMNTKLLQARAFMPQAYLDDDNGDDEMMETEESHAFAETDVSITRDSIIKSLASSSKAASSIGRAPLGAGNDSFARSDNSHQNQDNKATTSTVATRRTNASTHSKQQEARLTNRMQLAVRKVAVISLNMRGFHYYFHAAAPTSTALAGESSTSAPHHHHHHNHYNAVVTYCDKLTTAIQQMTADSNGIIDSFHGDHYVISFNGVKQPTLPASRAMALLLDLHHFLENDHDFFSRPSRHDIVSKHSSTVNPPEASLESNISASHHHRNTYFLGLSAGVAMGPARVGSLGTKTLKKFSVIGPVFSLSQQLERASKRLQQREGCYWGSYDDAITSTGSRRESTKQKGRGLHQGILCLPFGWCLASNAACVESDTNFNFLLVGHAYSQPSAAGHHYYSHHHGLQRPAAGLPAFMLVSRVPERADDEWLYQLNQTTNPLEPLNYGMRLLLALSTAYTEACSQRPRGAAELPREELLSSLPAFRFDNTDMSYSELVRTLGDLCARHGPDAGADAARADGNPLMRSEDMGLNNILVLSTSDEEDSAEAKASGGGRRRGTISGRSSVSGQAMFGGARRALERLLHQSETPRAGADSSRSLGSLAMLAMRTDPELTPSIMALVGWERLSLLLARLPAPRDDKRCSISTTHSTAFDQSFLLCDAPPSTSSREVSIIV